MNGSIKEQQQQMLELITKQKESVMENINKVEGSKVVQQIGIKVGELAAGVLNGSETTARETKKNSKLFGVSVVAGFLKSRMMYKMQNQPKVAAPEAPQSTETPKA